MTTRPLLVTDSLVSVLGTVTGSLESALGQTQRCPLFFPCPSHGLIYSSIDA